MRIIKSVYNTYGNLPKEVYIIFVARIINALGCFVAPLLAIILSKSIGLPSELIGIYISVAGLLNIFAAILGGKLTDKYGCRITLIVFPSIAAIIYTICAMLPVSIPVSYLIIAAGTFTGIAGPALDALIANLTTADNRRSAYSLSYLGFNLGFAFGPAIAGLLYKNHLPLIFLGDAITTLIYIALIVLFIKDKPSTIPLTKVKIENEKSESLYRVLMRKPFLIYFVILAAGLNFIYSQWDFMYPLHAMENFNVLGAKYYGLMASFNGLVVILSTPLLTASLKNKSSISCTIFGGILYAIGFGMLGFINELPFFFISVFIFTLGEIVLSISVTPYVMNHTPASHRGRMSGFIRIILGAGFTLGPICMGFALRYFTIEEGWIAIGVISLMISISIYISKSYLNKYP